MCCVNISFSVSKCPHCLHLKSIFFTCISVQKDVTPAVANKGNIQDETGSDDEEDDEDDIESEGEFEDGDDQSLVGIEDEIDLKGVFNEVPGSLSSSEMIFCTLDCQVKNVTLDLNLTVYCRRQQRLAFLSHQQRGVCGSFYC